MTEVARSCTTYEIRKFISLLANLSATLARLQATSGSISSPIDYFQKHETAGL